ncbi:hypothetical protein IE53DRAFT_389821 [Violaceomyces palustris]|uniref:Uncharacterized protein n=1 Tax=Violaceomyces palustris TaxID=1673888 RepID=A0ACD0NQC1_9BASI|nr:hypothetical protein IE53DRAFT_389821 [Violaceomyces palustris]
MPSKPSSATSTQTLGLTKRPMDLIYLAFFTVHLAASLCVDLQCMFDRPSDVFPKALTSTLEDYLSTSNDPFLLGAWSPRYSWFTVSLLTEIFFQMPCFCVGIYGLYKDDKRTYPLLIAYGMLATFSAVQCIFTVLHGEERQVLSDSNVSGLLKNYLPFAVIPAILTVDLILRTTKLIGGL